MSKKIMHKIFKISQLYEIISSKAIKQSKKFII